MGVWGSTGLAYKFALVDLQLPCVGDFLLTDSDSIVLGSLIVLTVFAGILKLWYNRIKSVLQVLLCKVFHLTKFKGCARQ
jgi:hypothetical protein